MHRILKVENGEFRFLSNASVDQVSNDRITSRIFAINSVAYRLGLINQNKTAIFYQVDDIDTHLFKSVSKLNIFCSAYIESDGEIRFSFNHMKYTEFGAPKKWNKYSLEQFRVNVLKPMIATITWVDTYDLRWNSDIKSFVLPYQTAAFKVSTNVVNVNERLLRLEINPKIKNYKFKQALQLLPKDQHILDRNLVTRTATTLQNIYSNDAMKLFKQLHYDLHETVHNGKQLAHETFIKFMVVVSLFLYPPAPKSKYSNVLLLKHNSFYNLEFVPTLIKRAIDSCLNCPHSIDLNLLNKTLQYFTNLNLEPAYGETDGEVFEQEYNDEADHLHTHSTSRRFNRIGYTKRNIHNHLKSNK